MHHYEAHGYAGDLLGWRSEVVARIKDFFARKAFPASEKLVEGIAGLVHRLESSVPAYQLKSAVKDLLATLRRAEPEAVAGDLDREVEELYSRIRVYRRRESIENYPEYLFSVTISL
jgi:hypothetical protein